MTKNIILLLFSSIFLSCADKKDESLNIVISDPYTNLELVSQLFLTDSAVRTEENPNPLISKLYPNVYIGDNGSTYLTPSTFLGFAFSKDTLEINKIIKSSVFLPNDANYKWTKTICTTMPDYALNARKINEKKVEVTNKDIASINIDNANDFVIPKVIKSLLGKTEFIITIKFKPNVLTKLKELKPNGDGVLIQCNFNDNPLYFSQDIDQLKNGLILGRDISKSFVDSFKSKYPLLIKGH